MLDSNTHVGRWLNWTVFTNYIHKWVMQYFHTYSDFAPHSTGDSFVGLFYKETKNNMVAPIANVLVTLTVIKYLCALVPSASSVLYILTTTKIALE